MKLDLDELNLDNEKYIVVGVSAGPDSMALLDYLIKHIKTKIICAHINHNVRKESKEEQEFLENYCLKNNVIFEGMKIDMYCGKNFEAEAREKRYNFYFKILEKYQCKYLFLAHHGDDLIETVLMKISRGSNLEGYAGIKKISLFKNKYYIVRPLLNYTKQDILDYLKNNNIKYYIDRTNEDTNYTRNRYRKYILPFLKNEDINIHKKFIKYSEILTETDNYIKKETKNLVNKIYKNKKFYITDFNQLEDFMKKNILYYILNNLYDNKPNIVTERHINNIIKLINSNNNGSLNMPKGIIVSKEYNSILFNEIEKRKNNNYKIKLNKNNIINKHIIKIINNTTDDGNNICRIDSNEIRLPLYIRNINNGDFIEVLGLNGKKKVTDIFKEKKIPVNERNNYPLLVDSNDKILWIPNLKKSKFNKKKEEKYDIILRYYEREEEINE